MGSTANLTPIYNRLNGANGYHPFTADTFADWACEAGDIVSLTRNGQTYAAPLHQQTVTWRGRQQVAMQATGNREREPVERVSNRKLQSTAAGVSGGRSSKGKFHNFEVNDEHLLYEVFDENGKMARLEVEASQIRMELADEVSGLYSSLQLEASQIRSEVHNATSEIYSSITQTESQIRSEVVNAVSGLQSSITQTASQIRSEVSNAVSGLQSSITQEANRIGLVVEGYGTNAQVKRAAIILAINGEGGSTAHIDADEVYIGNSKSTTVINGKLNASDVTADYIQAKISAITLLSANALSVAGGINGSGTLTIAGLTTLNGSLRLGSGNSFSKCIVNAEVDGNTLKLTDSGGDVTNFSKATSLSGSWSGTTYTVTASPQGNTESTSVHLAVEGSPNPNATVYAKVYKDNPSVPANQLDATEMTLTNDVSNKKVTLSANGLTKGQVSTTPTYNAGWDYGQTQRVRSTGAAGSSEIIIKTLDYDEKFKITDTYTKSDGTTFDVTYTLKAKEDRWQTGFDAGEPSAVTIGSKITGTVYNVSVARGSYSAKALTVNASSVYNEGKTAGATSLSISGASTSDSTDKLMDGNYKWKVTATTTKGDGTSYTKSYVIESKHDMGIRQSGSGDSMTVTAACQPDGSHDAATKSRTYTLEIDSNNSNKVNLVYNGTVYASKTVSGGGGSYTKYYGPNGETTFTMYYMRNGSYLSAGSKNWYYKS